jgi:hypothetical protein
MLCCESCTTPSVRPASPLSPSCRDRSRASASPASPSRYPLPNAERHKHIAAKLPAMDVLACRTRPGLLAQDANRSARRGCSSPAHHDGKLDSENVLKIGHQSLESFRDVDRTRSIFSHSINPLMALLVHRCLAAVNTDDLPRDEPGALRSEECDGVGDVLRYCHTVEAASDRLHSNENLFHAFAVGL